MNCKNCGAELNEGALFCGNCGMKAEAAPVYEAPVQETYEAPAYEEPVSGEYHQETYENYQEQGSYVPPVMPEYNAAPAPSGERPNTVLWIVLSAVEIFTCCQITGIISLIFSIIGHVSAEKGDYADAASKIKVAKISFWIGLSVGLLAVVAYIFLVAIGVAAGLTEEILYY